MRNKFIWGLLTVVFFAMDALADTTNVAVDSAAKPFVAPNQGPLGIDNSTGLALYGAIIVFAILIVGLWRKNIIGAKQLELDSSKKNE
ncbi:MAG: hypothetical protein Q8896_05165 [Bacteroidota bacterium]|nr:hypothetical protein [Bacteroidota bacterium]MDP4237754.1 hypothetical protein [Bacteroidota bacterium]